MVVALTGAVSCNILDTESPSAFDASTIYSNYDLAEGCNFGIAEAFCDTINNAGYKSIIYANSHQMFILYDFETMKDYDFWLADYRDFPTMYYNFDMWQYATDGKVNGVEGDVDLNISFTDF